MNQSQLLRFSLILSDGQAKTFSKNLTKIIKLILFDCFGESITIREIAKRVKKVYSLEFSDDEINSALKRDKSKSFVLEKSAADPIYNKYTLSPDEYKKIADQGNKNIFENIVQRYKNSEEGQSFACETANVKAIILRYIYSVFNADVATVLSLMNYKGGNPLAAPPEQFNKEEVALLNSFLNWNDAEKNKFVFRAISCCFEYCMMTVKKNNSSYDSLFNGKKFFLDSNIVFRLAGFNNTERQEVVSAFLEKCKECGIKLAITNFTNDEINRTLTYQVEQLKRLLMDSAPISVEAVTALSSKYANLDFYEKYVNWVKVPKNKAADYGAFLTSLKKEVEKHLSKMEFVRFASYEQNELKKFIKLTESFSAFKCTRYKDIYKASIKTDIENYLYMTQLNATNTSNNFTDKKYYFISADHSYIDWVKEQEPGAIPTFVLPSVWYSIMLKYKGRTIDSANDYTAFCQFLNLRINSAEDEYAGEKEKMLGYILSLDEPTDIKEEIAFDIKERLSSETSEIIDIEEYAEFSHQKVTQKKVECALALAKEQHVLEKQALEKQAIEDTEKSKASGFEEGKYLGLEEGEKKGAEKILSIQAHNIARRNTLILGCLQIVSIIIIVFVLAWGFTHLQIWDTYQFVISGVSLSISLIGVRIKRICNYFNILTTDEKAITHKLQKKFNT
ncbi:MAG: hypothetical protein ACLSWV_02705 [Pygmaiobacter massiliensis]